MAPFRDDKEASYEREVGRLRERLAGYEGRRRGFYLCMVRLIVYGIAVFFIWPKARELFNGNSDLSAAAGTILLALLLVIGIVIAVYTGLDLRTRFLRHNSSSKDS